MNRALTSIVLAAAFALSGCAGHQHLASTSAPRGSPANTSIGHWEHRYPNNQNLVGIWIQQFPDNSFEAPLYEGKHPCMVYYIFADGRDHCFHYHPDGRMESQGWSQPPVWMLENLDIVYRPATLKALIRRAKANDRHA